MYAAVAIMAVFCLVVVLMKFRMPLWGALYAGTAATGLAFAMPPSAWARSVLGSAASRDTLELCTAVCMILVLSRIMDATGQFRRLLETLRGAVRDVRILYFSLPALIGLLPMPGGAVFSAPMLDAAAGDDGPSSAHRSAMNYWFRHIWEYSWPLYPGFLLAVRLSGAPARQVAFAQMPLTLLAAVAGAVALLGRIPGGGSGGGSRPGAVAPAVLRDLSPVIVAIVPALAAGVSMPVSLGAGVLTALLVNRVAFRDAVRLVVMNGKLPGMALMVLGIMAFKTVLGDSGGIGRLTAFLRQHDVPPAALLVALPFVSGFVTGIAVAFVGIAYPVLVPLYGGAGADGIALALPLAFASGFIGVLVSPVHLCLILSNQYFKADAVRVYRRVVPLCAVILAGALALHYLYRMF